MKEKCLGCGCTEMRACAGGCSWVIPNWCSACDTEKGLENRFITQWKKTFGSYDGRDIEPKEIYDFIIREMRIRSAVAWNEGLEQKKDIIKMRPKKK